MTYCLVFWEKKKSLQLQANLHSKSRPPPQVLIKSEDRTMKNMLIYRKLKKKKIHLLNRKLLQQQNTTVEIIV